MNTKDNLLAEIGKWPDLAELIDEFSGNGRNLSVSGLWGSAKAAVLSSLIKAGMDECLIVTYSTEDAELLADDLKWLLDNNVLYFPDYEILPYEDIPPQKSIISARQNVLRRLAERQTDPAPKPITIVTSIKALVKKVIPPDNFIASEFSLVKGQELEQEDIINRLLEMEYAREPIVEEIGQFSIHGSVIDIHPSGSDYPIRLELDYDSVSTIRTFDPLTQRSIKQIESCTVFHCGGTHQEFDDGGGALSTATIFDYFGARPGIFLDEPQAMFQELQAFMELVERMYKDALHDEHGQGSPLVRLRLEDEEDDYFGEDEDEPLISPVTPIVPEEIFIFEDALKEHLHKYPVVLFSFIHDPQAARELFPGEDVREFKLKMKTTDTVCSRLEETLNTIVVWRESYKIMILCDNEGQAERLNELIESREKEELEAELFTDDGFENWELNPDRNKKNKKKSDKQDASLTPVKEIRRELNYMKSQNKGSEDAAVNEEAGLTISVGDLHNGFIIPEINLAVFTDREIFRRYKRVRKKARFKGGKQIRSAFDLKYNDLIVHNDYGIGRYRGLYKMNQHGIDGDYLLVTYDGGDKLYVAASQIHLIQQYVGMENESVSLSKLGAKTWSKAKAKAQKAIEKMAKELVELYAVREIRPGYAFNTDTHWQHELEDAFIFDETPDQLEAIEKVKLDMEQNKPMDRLICGDVGYGKTEVAIRAAFKAVLDGKQVAVLVPTTILAQQHFRTFWERMADFPVTVDMLSRFKKPTEQRKVIAGLKDGSIDIVIGTHRLISRDIVFKDLGLVVVDEEQRFGVTHKEKLKKLKETVDVMTLTATPIPRTLYFSLSGLRDISLLNTAPEDRQPIITFVSRFDEKLIGEAVIREMERGGQIYFVHNRVQSIGGIARKLARIVPQAKVAVAHGQMDERELEKIMFDFIEGEYDVLLATTIIENGLDIANVNTIIIDRADMMGLSQLYQLRGRVGRDRYRAYAYLLVPPDTKVTSDARKRLQVIQECTDLGSGYKIAMRDLEIRGAGNLLGKQQHGNIAAIGLDLYCKMMEKEVNRIRGKLSDELPQVDLKIDVPSFIPNEYIMSERFRLDLYKRLSSIREEKDIEPLREEIEDRYGPLPEPLDNMISALSLKVKASAVGIERIGLKNGLLVLKFAAIPDWDHDAFGGIQRVYGEHRVFAQRQDGLFGIKVLPETNEAAMKTALDVINRLNKMN